MLERRSTFAAMSSQEAPFGLKDAAKNSEKAVYSERREGNGGRLYRQRRLGAFAAAMDFSPGPIRKKPAICGRIGTRNR